MTEFKSLQRARGKSKQDIIYKGITVSTDLISTSLPPFDRRCSFPTAVLFAICSKKSTSWNAERLKGDPKICSAYQSGEYVAYEI